MATPGKTARALGMVGLLAVLMLVGLPASAPAQQFRTLAAGAGGDDRGAHKDFSLRLVFALQSGPYVGGVSVTIRDESGRTSWIRCRPARGCSWTSRPAPTA